MLARDVWRLLGALVTALGIVALFWINPYDKSPVNQGLGLLLIFLGLLPMWRWTRSPSTDAVPVLGMIGFFYALCYGIAGLLTPDRFIGGIVVAEPDYTPALVAALISWGALNAGFALSKRCSAGSVPRPFSDIEPRHDEVALWFGYPVSLLADQGVDWFHLGDLVQTTGALHVFFFIWVLHAAWSGRFSSSVCRLVYVGLLPLELFLYSGLSDGKLVGLLVFGQLLGLTYASIKGRLPYLPLAVVVGLFLFLQPVKSAYRMETWKSDTQVGRVEGLIRFVHLGLDYYPDNESVSLLENMNATYSRINHLHTMTTIMIDTPNAVPFWDGMTYIPLLTKWIPRAIWLEKPLEDLGNFWAQAYGYLDADDDMTSYNLPWLPEMYMNFGWAGVVVISFLVGGLGAVVWSRLARHRPSSVFAAGLVLLSSFFFPESNLSLGVGRLVIDGLAITAVCWLIGSLWRRAPGATANDGVGAR